MLLMQENRSELSEPPEILLDLSENFSFRHSELEKVSIVHVVFRYNWHLTNNPLEFLMPYALDIRVTKVSLF